MLVGATPTLSELNQRTTGGCMETVVETPACYDPCILGVLCIAVVSLCSVCARCGERAFF